MENLEKSWKQEYESCALCESFQDGLKYVAWGKETYFESWLGVRKKPINILNDAQMEKIKITLTQKHMNDTRTTNHTNMFIGSRGKKRISKSKKGANRSQQMLSKKSVLSDANLTRR